MRRFLEDFMRNFLFGTGNFGQVVLHCVKNAGINVDAFIDLNEKNVGKKIGGLPVIDIKEVEKDSKIIIASNRNNYSYLHSLLVKYGLTNFQDCDEFLSNIDFETLEVDWSKERIESEIKTHLSRASNIKSGNKKLVVNSIDVVVTEKCSLKCKDCSNLMQYYEKPKNAEVEELSKDLFLILNSVDQVNELRFIGGEPLLVKSIYEFIENTSNFKNFNELVVFTNGTIIPSDEKMRMMSDPRIRFQISDYGISLSKRVKNLIQALSKFKIRYVVDRVTTWQNCATIEPKERTPEQNLSVFANCCVNDAFTLLHGRLYGCPFSAHAENLQAIPHAAGDSFELEDRSEGETREGFKKLMSKVFYQACKYCNGRDYTVSTVDAAVQTKKPLKYDKVIKLNAIL